MHKYHLFSNGPGDANIGLDKEDGFVGKIAQETGVYHNV